MHYTVLRIVLLLFLPISAWILYSWSFETLKIGSVELPKIDKIELLHLSMPTPSEAPIIAKPVLPPQKKIPEIAVVEKNADINDSINNEANNANNKTLAIEDAEVISQNKTKAIDEAEAISETEVIAQATPITCDENSSNSPEIKSNKERIFVLGDSMGQGVAYGLAQVKQRYPINFNSIAKCSTTTYYWLAYSKLEEKITAYKPTVIWVILGANEWNGVNSSTKVRILKIHKRLEKLGIKTYWITPPVSNATAFYGMIHDVYGNMTYDSRFLSLPRGPDHIHPTLQGYVTWTKEILSTLNIKKIK